MAIVQISQITNRLGLNADLPQLAGAELGWSTDTRQLYIGNGTLSEGAPVIGNTEILTEFSDILNIAASYTYKGTAAGYTVQTGPTPSTPVKLSLQNWMDQFASVLDFGAVGDGLTDDTAAINRALNQLYCQQSNPQIRRNLFFPAGVYAVSSPINIPPYATLYGEGSNSSIIRMIASGGTGTCVAQTADSLQQTGVNIGNAGAIPPRHITISSMGFQSLDNTKNIFLVDSATSTTFDNVGFFGSGTTSTLTSATLNTSCVTFAKSNGFMVKNIVLDRCIFFGSVYGIFNNSDTQGVTVTNGSFSTLYQGANVTNGATGTRITNNIFDTIYEYGILFGTVSLNVSGYNIFYDVANHFLGTTSPQQAVILIEGNNNASVGDMFQRSDLYAEQYPRVYLTDTVSIATTNGSQLQLGNKTVESGVAVELQTGHATPTTLFTVDNSIFWQQAVSFKIDYSIILGAGQFRTGVLFVASSERGGTILPITGASGDGTTVTLTFTTQPTAPFAIGSVISIDGIYPLDYNETYATVTSCTTSTVSYASVATDAYVSGGQVSLNNLNYSDDYVENSDTGIVLTVSQIGTVVSVQYTSLAATNAGQMSYSISYFNVA